ncbi:unnamed protein product, partial [Allacma fusca]
MWLVARADPEKSIISHPGYTTLVFALGYTWNLFIILNFESFR